MSNNFSLMLSLIFLSLFILFSGEVVIYQQTVSKTLAITNDLAIFIEKNGYEEDVINELDSVNYFTTVNVDAKRSMTSGITTYKLTTTKDYKAMSSIYSFMSQTIVCNITVYRKEYYVWI